jgi:transcriptional regulator of nitric oxide reductase
MKVYTNYGITEAKNLKTGTIGYPFRIESAEILPNADEEKDALLIELRKTLGGKMGFGYGLLGDKLYEEFMKDMKVSEVEKLVGKRVIGFVHENEIELQGLSAIR